MIIARADGHITASKERVNGKCPEVGTGLVKHCRIDGDRLVPHGEAIDVFNPSIIPINPGTFVVLAKFSTGEPYVSGVFDS